MCIRDRAVTSRDVDQALQGHQLTPKRLLAHTRRQSLRTVYGIAAGGRTSSLDVVRCSEDVARCQRVPPAAAATQPDHLAAELADDFAVVGFQVAQNQRA